MQKNKQELEKLLEPIEYNKLKTEMYKIKNIFASELLTWNRLDLSFKIRYLLYKNKNKAFAENVYFQDIKAQTLGKFQEGNTDKNNFEKFIKTFNNTFQDLQINGFDSNKTLIPLSHNLTIRNGAHRVSSAIVLNQEVTTVITESDDMIADYNYFLEREVSLKTIEEAVIKFIDYAPENCYLAFLWPSGKNKIEESLKQFSKIIYQKELKLSSSGAYNLLYELYKHMDWVGTIENNFSGVKQKLIECFPSFDSFYVVAFQADSLDSVREIKENVRNIHNIGFSSIHITDTKEEAQRISRSVFNDNGIHFLNNSSPYKYSNLYQKLDDFQQFLSNQNIDKDDLLLDGSIVLALYGIRENYDIDFYVIKNILDNEFYEQHDSELKYHEVSKEDLIYDSKYYFEFYGFKIISFQQLYTMKENRGEEKDKNDCEIMKSLLEGNNIKKLFFIIKQKLFYYKIKFRLKSREIVVEFLRVIHLYDIVKRIVQKLRGDN
jgi:hypothetical protein